MSNQYVVFLRAVNVSGKNIVKMAVLKEVLEQSGFEAVKTYIQSGNIILKSKDGADGVSQQVHRLIQKYFDLDIIVFVCTPDMLQQALKHNPYPADVPPNKVYFTFMDAVPEPEALKALQAMDFGSDVWEIKDRVLYFYLPDGMANSKMSNNLFEKKLKVQATGRNLNTIRKVLAML